MVGIKTFQIIRPIESDSELGDNRYIHIGYAEGLFQPMSSKQLFAMAKQFPNAQSMMFLDIEADVNVGDQLQNTKQEAYTVVSCVDASGRYHHKEAFLEEAQTYKHVPTPLE